MPRVGIIVVQSRDYCCLESGLLLPTLFYDALIPAYYKDFRASYRIMQT
jgi:hypothetical protein